MLQVGVLAAAIVVAALRGGRLSGLADLRLSWWPLLLLGVAVQALTWPTPLQARLGTGAAAPWLYSASFLLLIAVTARNVRLPGLGLILAGLALNLAAILLGGLQMPVLAGAYERLGPTALAQDAQLLEQGIWLHYRPVLFEHPWQWLGDWLYLGWPRPRVYSPGDILTWVGGFALVQHLMLARRPAGNGSRRVVAGET